MKSSLKFAALALVGAATLASPAFAALKEGTQAPNFSAPAYLAGKPFTFKLADALKNGPVVVYFFPAPHTSGCNVEAHLFSEAIDQFKALHATVYDATLLMRPGWSDRTSYVIDSTGKITHVYSALSPNKHVEETLAAVKAIEAK